MGTKVSTAWKFVIKGENTLDFLVGNTSPNDLVGIVFEKIRFLPKEIVDLR